MAYPARPATSRTRRGRVRGGVGLAAGASPSRGAPTGKPRGWIGTSRQAGIIDVEFNATLQNGGWRGDSSTVGAGLRMYRESPNVRSAVDTLINPLLADDRHVSPGDPDSAEARAIAAVADEMLFGADASAALTRDRLLAVRDGCRLQEVVARWDPAVEFPRFVQRSGLTGAWDRLPGSTRGAYMVELVPRLPQSIDRWITNPDGSFGGVVQYFRNDDTGSYDSPTIPADRLLLWTYGEEGTNWEGDPAIRPAWALQQLEADILRKMGIALDRYAFGTPRVRETGDAPVSDEAWSRARTIVRDWQFSESGYLQQPRGLEFDILEAELKAGQTWLDLLDWIGRAIHRMCGLQHAYTGEGNGARSLHDSQWAASMLMQQRIEAMINAPLNALLERWTSWNGWAPELAPKIAPNDLRMSQPQDLAETLRVGREAGVFHPTIADEIRFREQIGAHELSDDEAAAIEDAASAPGIDETDDAEEDPEPGPEQDPPAEDDGDGEAMTTGGCNCGTVALAVQRRPHPGRLAALRTARAAGPVHALAEEFFDARGSFDARADRIDLMGEQLAPIVRDVADAYAARLAGKSVGEASKVRLPATLLVGIRRTIRRHLGAVALDGRDAVRRELREQAADPDYARKLVDAVEAADAGAQPLDDMPSAVEAFAAKTGKGVTRPDGTKVDLSDFESGAAKTSADAIGQKIEQSAQAAVQRGATAAPEISASVARDVTPRVLSGVVQPDVQGVYARSREIEMRAQGVEWGLYTTTPELSSQVCEECLDTASSPNNPFRLDSMAASEFATPNPNCLGGANCWCAVIGLSTPPESVDRLREIAARGGSRDG